MEKFLGLPMLASEHGKDVDNFILYVHYLMGVLFVGWFAYFLFALFRFRAPNRSPYFLSTTRLWLRSRPWPVRMLVVLNKQTFPAISCSSFSWLGQCRF